MVSRTLGNKLTERFGQPVIVESITQGVGIVGNQMVSKSAPDGHTLAMLTGGFTTQAAVMKSLPYDPVRDFAFVTSVVAYPMFLLVAPNSPITSFQDLIDRARAAPGKVNYAIIGGGSVYHLLGKWIENRAGVEMTAVPYRGSVAGLHRRDRRPARCHDRYRDLGDPAHPQRPAAGARGVVAAALSADAGYA